MPNDSLMQLLSLRPQQQPQPQAPAPASALSTLLGANQLPTMQPITNALASNAMLPHPAQPSAPAPQHHGFLGPDSPVRNFLGVLGDALLVAHGQQPFHQQEMERRRTGEALSNYLGNTDAMLAQLFKINPELATQAMAIRRENDFRSASSDMLLNKGAPQPGGQAVPQPGDPSVPSADERAIRADPDKYLTFRGKQIDMTAGQLKLASDLHDSVMQVLGGAHDQASYDAAKQQAASIYSQYGYDPANAHLPDQYSPETIHDLQMQGMDTSKQLQAVARENKLNWDIQDDQIDNTRLEEGQQIRHQDRIRGQNMTDARVRGAASYKGAGGSGQQPGAAKTPKSENALFTDIQRRFNAGEPVTDRERQFAHDYQQRHGGRVPQGRGGPRGAGGNDGAIIRNPTTGQRMQLVGGKWVPIK